MIYKLLAPDLIDLHDLELLVVDDLHDLELLVVDDLHVVGGEESVVALGSQALPGVSGCDSMVWYSIPGT